MIVVDTNIIAYFYLKGEHTQQAEDARRQDPFWTAPLLWRSEFRNVLAQYMRRDLLTLRDAHQIMDRATEMMRRHEYRVSSLYVLNLVADSVCTAYDCEYVALAQDLEVPLVTTDRQILDQFPHVAISLDTFLASSKN
jgi:predicted nucleic acid-binding protein